MAEFEQRREKILTEVGVNEWEIIVFRIAGGYYAINVDKVREIMPFKGCTSLPLTNECIRGILEIRGEIVPILDLRLYYQQPANDEHTSVIITEFNQMKVGFLVDEVQRIFRVKGDDFDDTLSNTPFQGPTVLYVIKREGHNIMLLDFEKIVIDVAPHLMMKIKKEYFAKPVRSEKRILVAEDSPMIRKLIEDSLKAGGYMLITSKQNGQEALDALERGEIFDITISDIEMPKMDGLTLVRRIKEHKEIPIKSMPVIMFSSIMAEDISRKCQAAGANAWISKPEIDKLVEMVDNQLGV